MYWSHRPHRLFWFGIGSVITYSVMKCHERKGIEMSHAYPAPPPIDMAAYGQNQQQQASAPAVTVTHTHRHGWGWRHGDRHGDRTVPNDSQPAAAPASTPAGFFEGERVKEMGYQASQTMSELSEATIDSAIANLQSIRTKLAERRNRVDQTTPSPAPEQKAPERWV
ncbi:hypothetical protein EVG20_g3907 [Dentipellis fragilis]|uniref:Uncharacterized protein n=1 Tax=Dentipellis fragilis TaxID=205917 RepID=A0A4Y9Z147_9AGAM|nr:hypothetical protein EVG20_g3907 [Dentipellis fragilis]